MNKVVIYLFILFTFISLSLNSQSIEEIEELIRKNPEVLNYDAKSIQENIVPSGRDKSIDSEENEEIVISSSEIFGHDFINKIPKSISSTSDLPVPNNYVISLGEELRIILTGGVNDSFIVKVGLDGNILFPELGNLNIFGNTITEVRKKIKQLIELSYVGTEVSVSIASIAAKKINIVGAVKNPGTYIVNPFSTITSALAYSGGFEDYASLRQITLIRDNQKTNFDLYDLLVMGDRKSDVNIEQGDTLLIKSTSNFVEIAGEINRPKIYEYKATDKYKDLINFALGLNRVANKSSISASLDQGGIKTTIFVKEEDLIGDKDLELFHVGKNISVDFTDVFVSGTAVTSGYFELNENTKLSEFLKRLKFSSDIYPYFAVLDQSSSNGLIKNRYTFSLKDPKSMSNLTITKNSVLRFFSRNEIESGTALTELASSKEYVQLKLPERDAIQIPISGKTSPKDLYAYFSTFEGDIDKANVFVVTNDDIYKNVFTKEFDSRNIISISFPPIKQNIISVAISGEVKNPGTYLVPSSTNLLDLYTLAGGFNEKAFQKGIIINRKEVREKQIRAINEARSVLSDAMIQKSSSISDGGKLDIEAILSLSSLIDPTGRIAGDFDMNSLATKNFILKDEDVIIVPSESYEIVVQGEVLNSASFIYKPFMSYRDYIESAGGFSSFADKRGVFIIRADGTSALSGTSKFFGQAKLMPGDTIVVPRDLDQIQTLPTISIATKIISDIAFSAASINAIKD
tara:strand:- start:69 stop:2303 length:2235 start_codon:yes stop_codon:yes gene_type:complete